MSTFALLGMVEVIGLALLILLIVLLCLPGTIGPNRYGPDPLEGQRPPPGGWPQAPRTPATVVAPPPAA